VGGPFRRRTLVVLSFSLAPLMSARAADRLDPDRPVIVKFSVASRVGEAQVLATATFQSSGLQMLAEGGTITVNGVPLVAAPLKKQGYWYNGPLPVAARYELEYSLGAGTPTVRKMIVHRSFVPALPPSVSRGRGLVINFVGAPIQAGETLFAEITGGSGSTRWGQVLRPSANGNQLIINASSLTGARLGEANLYVGVVVREATAVSDGGSLSSSHAVGSEVPVTVTD